MALLLSESFPSDRSRLSRLPDELEALRRSCAMSEAAFYNVVLAMTEAVVNAIVHGNKEDPSKRVTMELTCDEKGIHCRVSDEGEGFSLEEVADPVAPENLFKEGGRGVFIIRAVSTELTIESTSEGTTMWFTIDRGLDQSEGEAQERGEE